ncbi:hypothetical protein WJX73_008237 [Symbiochloris irregularis]|uniref:Exportin-1/Importin-beta-like domain-containing protein n=1 Tax=Symbiochloris irregularis TaxID=706552 RepID=A0AAW1P8N6_9CHLO
MTEEIEACNALAAVGWLGGLLARSHQALNAVHNPSTDKEARDKHTRYLEDWQSATEAWTISDAVLHEPNCPLQLQFYCAQTLRFKVQRDFEELPEPAVANLRSSLADLLLRYYKGPSAVRTQLALAIAGMAAHAPADSWEGGGPLPWFASRISGKPTEAALTCMLELLTILPQEAIQVKHLLSVKPDRRRMIKKELALATPLALQMLTSCLNQQGVGIREHVLRAFAAWAELGGMASMDAAQLAQHPLVEAALAGLSNEDVFDSSVDAVVQLIYVSSGAGSPLPQMEPLVQRLVPAVLQQRGLFTRALGHAMQTAPNDVPEDADLAKGLARMFAELAECYCTLIATGTAELLTC